MRILVCGINYAPDFVGAARYTTELCETLAAYGHEVCVVTAPPYYPAWKVPRGYRRWRYSLEEHAGIRVRRVPLYVPRKPSGARRLVHHASFALTSAPLVISEAFRWRPHLMLSIAPSLMSSAVVALLARRTGAASWLHVHDFEIDAAFSLGLLRNERLRPRMLAAERWILRAFDRVSTIAPKMLQQLAHKGVEADKLCEVRNWVDTKEIAPIDRQTSYREELGLKAADLVALYSGTMSTKQGLELILEAAKEIEQSHPHVRFILCGEGPARAKLEELAKGLTNVDFINLQASSRLIELLGTADIHLLPQRAEAADLVLPSKLGGIFASGRPVVAVAAPGSGLANEIEGAGLVVPPGGDSRTLAAAVRRLTDDAELRRVLGANARRRAIERWDKTAILRSLDREFSMVCGEAETTPFSQTQLSTAPPS